MKETERGVSNGSNRRCRCNNAMGSALCTVAAIISPGSAAKARAPARDCSRYPKDAAKVLRCLKERYDAFIG